MAKFRELNSVEIAEIYQELNNFMLALGRSAYIIKDLSNGVYIVKIFDDFKLRNCVGIEEFSSLKSLSKGLNYLCEKYS